MVICIIICYSSLNLHPLHFTDACIKEKSANTFIWFSHSLLMYTFIRWFFFFFFFFFSVYSYKNNDLIILQNSGGPKDGYSFG
jgi:hypothetical protein